MNDEVRRLLARQASWQRELKSLSWPEKLRMAASIRDSILHLRRERSPIAPHAPAPQPAPEPD